MTKYLSRIENLLLLFPLLFLLMENKFYKNQEIDIHLHDTYIVVNIFHFFIIVFILFLLPYFLHTMLRWKGKRHPVTCTLHVVFTLLLFIIAAVAFVKADSIAGAKWIMNIVWALAGLQGLFIIYFWFAYWGS